MNHRANIYALRSLNVRWIICVTAVGSLQEKVRAARCRAPVAVLRSHQPARRHHTFFGDGIAAHVGFAEPISDNLRNLILRNAARELGVTVHNGGTYVNMDGPAFSTRAESELNRRLGFDVIGMTNLPEAKLAREAEIALATLAMITDYDCWKVDEEPVSAADGLRTSDRECRDGEEDPCRGDSANPDGSELAGTPRLDTAMVTDRKLWPTATRERLIAPILGKIFLRHKKRRYLPCQIVEI